VWQVLPSVGDKNDFVGICTLLEYFPSSLILSFGHKYELMSRVEVQAGQSVWR